MLTLGRRRRWTPRALLLLVAALLAYAQPCLCSVPTAPAPDCCGSQTSVDGCACPSRDLDPSRTVAAPLPALPVVPAVAPPPRVSAVRVPVPPMARAPRTELRQTATRAPPVV